MKYLNVSGVILGLIAAFNGVQASLSGSGVIDQSDWWWIALIAFAAGLIIMGLVLWAVTAWMRRRLASRITLAQEERERAVLRNGAISRAEGSTEAMEPVLNISEAARADNQATAAIADEGGPVDPYGNWAERSRPATAVGGVMYPNRSTGARSDAGSVSPPGMVFAADGEDGVLYTAPPITPRSTRRPPRHPRHTSFGSSATMYGDDRDQDAGGAPFTYEPSPEKSEMGLRGDRSMYVSPMIPAKSGRRPSHEKSDELLAELEALEKAKKDLEEAKAAAEAKAAEDAARAAETEAQLNKLKEEMDTVRGEKTELEVWKEKEATRLAAEAEELARARAAEAELARKREQELDFMKGELVKTKTELEAAVEAAHEELETSRRENDEKTAALESQKHELEAEQESTLKELEDLRHQLTVKAQEASQEQLALEQEKLKLREELVDTRQELQATHETQKEMEDRLQREADEREAIENEKARLAQSLEDSKRHLETTVRAKLAVEKQLEVRRDVRIRLQAEVDELKTNLESQETTNDQLRFQVDNLRTALDSETRARDQLRDLKKEVASQHAQMKALVKSKDQLEERVEAVKDAPGMKPDPALFDIPADAVPDVPAPALIAVSEYRAKSRASGRDSAAALSPITPASPPPPAPLDLTGGVDDGASDGENDGENSVRSPPSTGRSRGAPSPVLIMSPAGRKALSPLSNGPLSAGARSMSSLRSTQDVEDDEAFTREVMMLRETMTADAQLNSGLRNGYAELSTQMDEIQVLQDAQVAAVAELEEKKQAIVDELLHLKQEVSMAEGSITASQESLATPETARITQLEELKYAVEEEAQRRRLSRIILTQELSKIRNQLVSGQVTQDELSGMNADLQREVAELKAKLASKTGKGSKQSTGGQFVRRVKPVGNWSSPGAAQDRHTAGNTLSAPGGATKQGLVVGGPVHREGHSAPNLLSPQAMELGVISPRRAMSAGTKRPRRRSIVASKQGGGGVDETGVLRLPGVQEVQAAQNSDELGFELRKASLTYTARRGDRVDEAMAEFLHERGHSIPEVPISRKAQGLYQYGSRTMSVVLRGGELHVKQNHGIYTPLPEYVARYGRMEAIRVQSAAGHKRMRDMVTVSTAVGGFRDGLSPGTSPRSPVKSPSGANKVVRSPRILA